MTGLTFKLPSVFYLEMNEKTNERILCEASRGSELEKS